VAHPDSLKVRCLADSGIFLDHQDPRALSVRL
jgi:hypothetical protein